MDDLWTLVRFGHLLAVAVWVGGILIMGAVVVPAVRAGQERAVARSTIVAVARRFGILAGIAWVALLGTGLALLHHRGITPAELPDSDYGRRVLIKLMLLLAMGVVAGVHALWQGPRATRAEARGDLRAARRWRRVGIALDAGLLLGSVAALWLAASLIP